MTTQDTQETREGCNNFLLQGCVCTQETPTVPEDEKTRGLSPAGRRLRQHLIDIYTFPSSEMLKRDMEEHPETWVD